MPAIRIERLAKRYHIADARVPYKTLRDAVTRVAASPFRRAWGLIRGHAAAAADLRAEFWALRDISFDVEEGEVLGIVGHNGAGKTTLLKVLSRITTPTEGRAEIYGRVGSLLEVGTGFHSELTGRENIYLNGSILGMKHEEIRRKFDEIVAFAEVDRFLDTPVKHYSSGMHVRLAFAVAAHLDPEILFIDEVLSVGDAAFQKKSLGKMEEVARGGRTILFVSHNMVAVQNLCDRVVWLDHGHVRRDGEAQDVIAAYLATVRSGQRERYWSAGEAPGGEAGALRGMRVQPLGGGPHDEIRTDLPIVFEIDYERRRPGRRLHVTLQLVTDNGVWVMESASCEDPGWTSSSLDTGPMRCRCEVPANLLNSGVHSAGLILVEEGSRAIARVRDVVSFEVHDREDRAYGWYGRYRGAVHPRLAWETRTLSAPLAELRTVETE